MNTNALKQLLQELRNSNYYKESGSENIRITSIHSKDTEKRIEDYFIKNITSEEDKIVKNLKKLQSECEKDNEVAKKTITISRPDLILDLIETHLSTKEKVLKFLSRKYSDGQDLIDDYEATEKSLKKVNSLTDEVFSFKDKFNLHFVIPKYMELTKKICKISEVVDFIDDCLSSIEDYEDFIQEFSDYRHDYKDDYSKEFSEKRKDCGLLKHQMKYYRQLLTLYADNSIRIYGKTCNMIEGLK